ncbi:MAG: SMP-30/gluconolactonase/LRE family protein [Rhodobiaceae bacterium]|jgi:sugar lactone lactonase YvrE|nr:SMP-30/gluconolactonase/LRE family protein [Rhodobiaceae bacterium]MBT7279999.1 SMP-30/gluconolactonase/LRE family protein [Rhodobiaceae bacterium]MDG2496192.1 SMP-30/gluconolactonase/LRE family protein [Alphaproteobacteria bacterium]
MSQSGLQSVQKRPFLSIFIGLLAVSLGYLLLWPVPFDPIAGPERQPNPAGTGVFAKNNELAKAQLIDSGHGPEGIAFDGEGRLYTGLHNGDVVRLRLEGGFELIGNTGGRPLGLNFDAQGQLIIADAIAGLIAMAPDGTVTTLATDFEGKRMIFVDDLAIASDGKIYFSDASQRHAYGSDIIEVFERRPSGRLMVYDPRDKSLAVLLDDLYFANGVALSQAEDFVLVNETFEHRIMRYWLDGPKAGTADVFIDNLPGYIDNITEGPNGSFWLAVVSARADELDALVPAPFMRKVVWRILQLTGGSPAQQHSYAVKLDANGKPLVSLEDDSGHIYMMTSVLERDAKLYLGSLTNHAIGVLPAP